MLFNEINVRTPEATILFMHKTIDKIPAELMSKGDLNQADLSRLAKFG